MYLKNFKSTELKIATWSLITRFSKLIFNSINQICKNFQSKQDLHYIVLAFLNFRKEDGEFYESESDHETAQSKRLRIAKEYIKQLEAEGKLFLFIKEEISMFWNLNFIL